MIAYGLVHSCIWAGFVPSVVEEKEREGGRERRNRGSTKRNVVVKSAPLYLRSLE